MNLRFLLLMRHAKHTRGRLDEPKPKGPTPLDDIASSLDKLAKRSATIWGTGISRTSDCVLTDEGRYETLVAAKRLKDFLSEGEWRGKLTLGAVMYYHDENESEKIEAKDTALAFCEGYGFAAKPTPRKLLGPLTKSSALKKAGRESPLEVDVKNEACKLATGRDNAVLVVGHQPAVGWLASAFLGRPVPIAQSEILCIDLKDEGAPLLTWTISAADDVIEDLREKIKSKMALANLLGGFITAGIGVFLTTLSDKAKIGSLGVQVPVIFFAAFCLVLAVALYLRTMFSYDSLLMPIRFWAESATGMEHRPPWIVSRPPSGAHWILYQNMIRIWQWQFVPATFLALCGLFMLWGGVAFGTQPVSHSAIWWQKALACSLSLSIPALALLVLVGTRIKNIRKGLPGGWSSFRKCRGLGAKFRHLCGPWLGSED
jgi:hypothetical protein